ncbi:NUDIX domain-containing protein [Vibrio sp. SCSIO 43136]|uniref:NUDIX hydrolase n=1 Tax=Vibrio sp. SCSIO 43136 TaxID=2819101 RepID=UPI00207541B5|nr:NUDIX domain-containing protein [Vibrio sp. SCSIO 43136]USD67906.1 NUDIX domain-containing protein [Vibrio sp. SCSIO 43136]
MYCPKCGEASFNHVAANQYVCHQCQFTYFQNVAAAVAVAIVCGDELLVVIRGRDPMRGHWDLPGGFVDPDESLEQACVRELEEELGLNQALKLEFIGSFPNTYPYKEVVYKTCDVLFGCRLATKPNVVANDDVSGFQWVKIADVVPEKFAFESSTRILPWLNTLE